LVFYYFVRNFYHNNLTMDTKNRMPEDNTSKPEYTGRRIVMIDADASYKKINDAAKGVSLRLSFSKDYKNHEEDYINAFRDSDGIVFEKFGVAVINANYEAELDQLTSVPQARRVFLYDEPERYLYTLNSTRKGNFVKSIWNLFCSMFAKWLNKDPDFCRDNSNPMPLPDSFADDENTYWGIKAIRLLANTYSGKGIKVAVLDTGINGAHPDFSERGVISKSFIPDETVNDLNGHGTHCIGNAAGYVRGDNGIRYGVANDASIYVGKVLSNVGSGSDSGILAGMEWAMENGCKIISMSLGASIRPGQAYSRIYDDIAKNALDQGTMIIAAAGNDSRRSQGLIQAVNHPANCPNIMAVAAMNRLLNVADFSCGSVNKDIGQVVDIAGPGVAVYSAYKNPEQYASLSGTSMATPFVAGVAALMWEKHPKATPREIWELIKKHARPVPLSVDDVGAGLVQVPD
jgi:subtilisin